MSRDNFESNLSSVLSKMLDDREIRLGVGAARFVSVKDNKTLTLYMNNGLIYSIQSSSYPYELIRRIATSEYISDEQAEELSQKFPDFSDHRIIEHVINNKLVPEKTVTAYIKDISLGAFDDALGWGHVNAEWRPHESTSKYVIPKVEPKILLHVANNRKLGFEQFAKTWGIETKDIPNLQYKTNGEPIVHDQTTANIIGMGNGEWRVYDISSQYAISLFTATYLLNDIWQKGGVTLYYDREYPIYPPNLSSLDVEKIKNGEKESPNLKRGLMPEAEQPKPQPKDEFPEHPRIKVGKELQRKNQELAELQHKVAVAERIIERTQLELRRDRAALTKVNGEYNKMLKDYKKLGSSGK